MGCFFPCGVLNIVGWIIGHYHGLRYAQLLKEICQRLRDEINIPCLRFLSFSQSIILKKANRFHSYLLSLWGGGKKGGGKEPPPQSLSKGRRSSPYLSRNVGDHKPVRMVDDRQSILANYHPYSSRVVRLGGVNEPAGLVIVVKARCLPEPAEAVASLP